MCFAEECGKSRFSRSKPVFFVGMPVFSKNLL